MDFQPSKIVSSTSEPPLKKNPTNSHTCSNSVQISQTGQKNLFRKTSPDNWPASFLGVLLQGSKMKVGETMNLKPKTNQGVNEGSKEKSCLCFYTCELTRRPRTRRSCGTSHQHPLASKATAVTREKRKSVCHSLIWSQDRGGRTETAFAEHYVMV